LICVNGSLDPTVLVADSKLPRGSTGPSPFFGLDVVGSLEDPESAAPFRKFAQAEF
jgi:hypothetical protein